MDARLRRRLNPTVFATATFIANILLVVSIVAVPQRLSKQARWEELRACGTDRPATLSYPTISLFLKQKAISFFAVAGLSEPCTEFR
jgi:hypothetical protein